MKNTEDVRKHAAVCPERQRQHVEKGTALDRCHMSLLARALRLDFDTAALQRPGSLADAS
jgi:hypothetical protein